METSEDLDNSRDQTFRATARKDHFVRGRESITDTPQPYGEPCDEHRFPQPSRRTSSGTGSTGVGPGCQWMTHRNQRDADLEQPSGRTLPGASRLSADRPRSDGRLGEDAVAMLTYRGAKSASPPCLLACRRRFLADWQLSKR
jgi:hypothetical protein